MAAVAALPHDSGERSSGAPKNKIEKIEMSSPSSESPRSRLLWESSPPVQDDDADGPQEYTRDLEE